MSGTSGGGFDALTGAGTGSPEGPRPGAAGRHPDHAAPARRRPPGSCWCATARRCATCPGVCGGPIGCTGLTDRGRAQVAVLRDRLRETGELAGADALYASVLPRAVETAGSSPRPCGRPATDGARPSRSQECGFCELHPGEADGLDWRSSAPGSATRTGTPTPAGASPRGARAGPGSSTGCRTTLDAVAARHPGELVVVACHAGVVEASLLAKLPVVGGLDGARMKLRTQHASLTTWEVEAAGGS